MATWPATLPRPSQAGNQGDSGLNVQRTDFDAAPARQRLRYGASPDDLTLNWKFNQAEMAIFVAFWRDDINRGTDWFLMNFDLGLGETSHELRFVSGRYQYQRLAGSNWQISAKFDVRVI